MASQKRLRAVGPDDAPPPKKRAPLTVTQAASSGSQRDLLAAMRDRVAKDVEDPNTPSRDLAALTRRLMEITREIEAIDARAEEDDGDEDAPDAAWGTC